MFDIDKFRDRFARAHGRHDHDHHGHDHHGHDRGDRHGNWGGHKRFAHGGRDDADGGDERRGGFFNRGRHGHGQGHGHGHHGDHGPHHGERGGRRGGLGRFFAHGDLRLVVLSVVDEKSSHGYEIIKAIEERVGGAYSPSPGVIYPTLTLLEELGYVALSAASQGAKKLFEITAEGKAYLKLHQQAVDGLFTRMDEAGRTHRSGAEPQIVRAMENLKLALKLRLANGPLSPEQVTAVATALDAAAQAVERS